MEPFQEITVQRAKNGDSKAFAQLYSLFAQDLYRFACYYLGNRYDAEDAVQNAVLAAWRSLPSLRKNSAFKSWLFTILSNSCKELLAKRAENRNVVPLFEVEYLAADESSSGNRNAVEMASVMETLPEIDRNIILLSVIGNYTSAEIAEMLHMRPGSVRSRQSRAMEKLRAALQPQSQKG